MSYLMNWLSNVIGLPFFIVIPLALFAFILCYIILEEIYNKIDKCMGNCKLREQWKFFKGISLFVLCISLLVVLITSNIKSCIDNVNINNNEEPYIRGHGH